MSAPIYCNVLSKLARARGGVDPRFASGWVNHRDIQFIRFFCTFGRKYARPPNSPMREGRWHGGRQRLLGGLRPRQNPSYLEHRSQQCPSHEPQRPSKSMGPEARLPPSERPREGLTCKAQRARGVSHAWASARGCRMSIQSGQCEALRSIRTPPNPIPPPPLGAPRSLHK